MTRFITRPPAPPELATARGLPRPHTATFAGYNAGRGSVRNGRAPWRSTRSQGRRGRLSSRSRSPKPAITCSGSWRTCRSIGRGSGGTRLQIEADPLRRQRRIARLNTPTLQRPNGYSPRAMACRHSRAQASLGCRMGGNQTATLSRLSRVAGHREYEREKLASPVRAGGPRWSTRRRSRLLHPRRDVRRESFRPRRHTAIICRERRTGIQHDCWKYRSARRAAQPGDTGGNNLAR